MENKKKVALSIAGFDPSSGAGILADIKTFHTFNIYGLACISSLTVQNTVAVFNKEDVSLSIFDETLDKIFTDFVIDGIKIGMIPNKEYIFIIEKYLKKYGVKNLVIDPVLISSSGKNLLDINSYNIFFETLFKYATLITPNLNEARIIFGKTINEKDDIFLACKEIAKQYKTNVLIKGGHSLKDDEAFATDVLFENDSFSTFSSKMLEKNVHGTGCVLSSVILANLVNGFSIQKSVEISKKIYARCHFS